MPKKILFQITFLFITFSYTVGQSLTGTVTDGESGEPLASATLLIIELDHGTITNENGDFSIPIANLEGNYTIRVQHLSYATKNIQVTFPDDTEQDLVISLIPASVNLRELILTTSPSGSIVDYQPGQVFNSEELQVRSSNSFGEMLDGSPGVSMRSFGSVTSRPVIRGLDGDRVLVLQNGERMGDLSETAHDHSISMEPLAANRIEVVRGPASLLYGSSALGGVVNIFNEDIPDRWDPGTSGNFALYGNTGNQSGAAYGHILQGTDRWAVNSRFSFREAGDLYTPDGKLPGTSITNMTGSAGLGLQFGDLKGGLAISGLDKTYGLPDSPDNPDEELEIRMDNLKLQARTTWKRDGFIKNIELRLNAVRYFHEEIGIDLSEGGRDESVGLDFLQHSINSTITLRHEPLSFLDSGAIGINTEIRSLQVGGIEALTPNATSQSLAGFFFEEIPVSTLLRIQFGARLDLRTMHATENERYPEFSENKTTGTVSGSIGLNYKPVQYLEFGAQAARAHRGPNAEELYADSPHLGVAAYEVGDPTLGNEIGHGIDLFGRFTSSWVALEIAAFYNRINDFIVRQPTGQTHAPSGFDMYEYRNANAELLGGELIIKANLTNHLTFTGSADYTHGSQLGEKQNPLPFMPPLKSNLAIRYDTNIWWLGMKSNLVNRQHRTVEGELETGGYILLNLNAGYRFTRSGNHVFSIRLDNAGNTRYRDHLSRVESRNSPMPGRSANLTYRWMF
ncbi:MAG: TonB-dependent receptor [Balneolales bacterium]